MHERYARRGERGWAVTAHFFRQKNRQLLPMCGERCPINVGETEARNRRSVVARPPFPTALVQEDKPQGEVPEVLASPTEPSPDPDGDCGAVRFKVTLPE
jgi:hypothetical protein